MGDVEIKYIRRYKKRMEVAMGRAFTAGLIVGGTTVFVIYRAVEVAFGP